MNPLISPARSYPALRSGGGSIDFGITPLVPGQSYINVVLTTSLSNTLWDTVCSVVNTDDPAPLNIWPGLVSAKSTTGFTVQLNGMPDSANYFLHWTIIPGASAPAVVATTYVFSGPSSGATTVASAPFTVHLPSGQTVPGPVTVTPSAGGGGGTFTPTTVSLTTAAPSATFTYTPASTGAKTIGVTNSGGLTNPGSLSYTATIAPLADGDPVSTWHDSSVNGNDATMTGSNRPTFKTTIVNGKPVVRFTSAGQSKLNLTTPISGASPFTVFAVMKVATGTSRLDSLDGSDGGSPHGPLNSSNSVFVFDRNSYVGTIGPTTFAFHVLTGSSFGSGGAFQLYIDGTSNLGSPTGAANSGNFTTIGYDSSTPTYCDGDIAEIIIYGRDFNTVGPADRINIQQYLAAKYGITVAGGGSAVDPSTVTGLLGWWKADSL